MRGAIEDGDEVDGDRDAACVGDHLFGARNFETERRYRQYGGLVCRAGTAGIPRLHDCDAGIGLRHDDDSRFANSLVRRRIHRGDDRRHRHGQAACRTARK